MKKRGFTLVEMIAVIAILAILGAVLVPRILGYQMKANKSKIQSSSRSMIHVIQAYNCDKEKRVSGDIVNTKTVIDTDKVKFIFASAVNNENGIIVVSESGDVYNKIKDLTLEQLVGLSKGYFTLNPDGSVNEVSIITSSINNE